MSAKPLLADDGLPQGWFWPADAELYLASAGELPMGSRIVEVGAWLGRSLAMLLPVALARHHAVWCVDTWRGSPNDETSGIVSQGLNAFETFKANMVHLGFWGTFTAIHADQASAALRFADHSLDLIFLDADHSYESVVRDIRLWWPRLRPGGLMLGHDYSPRYPGVSNAVRELFGKPDDVSGMTWRKQKAIADGPGGKRGMDGKPRSAPATADTS